MARVSLAENTRFLTLKVMKNLAIVAVVFFALLLSTGALAKSATPQKQVERGRYLAKIAGCNDCHTPGYLISAGNVPESKWLIGDKLGWRGPWGTTYGTNLRLFVNGMTEDGWVETARALKSRPTMPWFNLNAMAEDDLRAIYQFIRYLGPGGEPAPAYVPPGEEPKGPYVSFPVPPK